MEEMICRRAKYERRKNLKKSMQLQYLKQVVFWRYIADVLVMVAVDLIVQPMSDSAVLRMSR